MQPVNPEFVLDPDQEHALQRCLSGANVFITGGGGVGKSRVLKEITAALEAAGRHVALTATTGTAAVTIGGVTLHSFVSLGLASEDIPTLLRRVSSKFYLGNIWRPVKPLTLIIDEVSMLDPLYFVKIDQVARRARRDSSLPFGGAQIILVGDFCQLPPVKPNHQGVTIDSLGIFPGIEFAFEVPLWTELVDETIHLTTIHRQVGSSEHRFTECLQRARLGRLSDSDVALLSARVEHELDLTDGIEPTLLYAHRRSVDDINMGKMKKCPADTEHTYNALGTTRINKGWRNRKTAAKKLGAALRALKANIPVGARLSLRTSAQVMLVANLDVTGGLINGSRGIIMGFALNRNPVVQFVSGHIMTIEPWTWQTILPCGNAAVSQIPLRPAWALTIHKSQSQSIDKVIVGTAGIFSPGQGYVALSRVRSYDQLALTGFRKEHVFAHPKVTAFYDAVDGAQPAKKKRKFEPKT